MLVISNQPFVLITESVAESELTDFLEELETMKLLKKHLNVVRLLGYSSKEGRLIMWFNCWDVRQKKVGKLHMFYLCFMLYVLTFSSDPIELSIRYY